MSSRYLFVGGLHRSGTTLLHDILATSRDITGFGDTPAMENEGQHLQRVIPTAREVGGPGRFALFNRPGAHLTEVDCDRSHRDRLLAAWDPWWRDEEAQWLLEKSPPNMIRTRYLRAVFPESRQIVVVRHPIAVTLATRKWTGRWPQWIVAANWVRAHHILAGDLSSACGDVAVVRYEDLVRDPTAMAGALARWLSVEVPKPDQVRPGANESYLRRWRDEASVGSRAVLIGAQRMLAAHGYATQDVTPTDERDLTIH